MSPRSLVWYFLRKLCAITIPISHRRPIYVGLSISIVIAALLVNGSLISLATDQTPSATEAAASLEIVYGRPGQGQITDSTFQNEWLFLPNSKDRITISLDRTGDTLVPTLALLDDKGNVLAKADHDVTYAHAAISNFALPNPGRYVIAVGRYNGSTGKTFGKYKLMVSLLGLGADGYNPKFVEGMIQLSQPRDGTLSENKWLDTWAFQTESADPITIIVSRVRGTLVPVLSLFDANWKQIATGTLDESFSMVAITKFAPVASSQYYVTINRLDGTNGGTTGDYRLMVVQGQQQ